MPKTISGVIGRYEIQRALGGGGMGVLYLARDPAIDRLVAIKLLRDGLDSRDVRERFAREARSAGRLHHPNIVSIFDVGEHEGRPFIAMEYVRGETLEALIHGQKSVPLVQKLEWMEDLCAGLQYAHRSGIIHRDIKPANVMISEEGALKLLDFGIARLDASAMTHGVIGTPNYMAPEQIEGRTLDGRADIFSLGALFYELLSYRRAFPGELAAVLTQILLKAPEPLDKVAVGLDAQLASVVHRCLEKQPAARYPDCAALSRDIATVRLRLEFVAAKNPELAVLSAEEETAAKGDTPKRAEAAQIERWVAEGHEQLGLGALTAASLLVERALSLDSSSPVAGALREAVDEARRQLAEARDRTRRIDETLAAAEHELEAGSLEQAAALTAEALQIDSSHDASLALHARVVGAIDARQRAEEDARAEAAIDRARRIFAAGHHAEAIEELARFQPRHERVAGILAELQMEEGAIARRAGARRLEAERRELEEQERERAAAARVRMPSPYAEAPLLPRADGEREERENERFGGGPREARFSSIDPIDERGGRGLDWSLAPEPSRTIPSRSGTATAPPDLRRWAIGAAVAVAVVAAGAIALRRVAAPTTAPAPSTPEVPRPSIDSTAAPAPAPKPVDATPAAEPVAVTPPAPTSEVVSEPRLVQAPPADVDNSGQARLRSERDRLIREGQAAVEQRRYGSAIQIYQRLAAQFPSDSKIRDLLTSARNLEARRVQRFADLVQEGDQAREAREYDEAIRLYQAALAQNPDAADVAAKLSQTRAAKARAETGKR